MLRIILGIIAGYLIWSFVWVGTDMLLAALSPDWFGKNLVEFQNAYDRHEAYTSPFGVTISVLFLSIWCSLIAGFATALIADENKKSTFALGVLLLLTGVFVEVAYWNYFPVWYHFLFLFLLIPMTILGGKLKTVTPARRVLTS